MVSKGKQLKKQPLEEDTSNLSCDIIEIILSRLPVKSLIRFKSVSKPWNSMISDSRFAKVHLVQSKNSYFSETMNLIRYSCTLGHQQFKFTNQGLQLEASITFPLEKHHNPMSIRTLCCYDGLVLLETSACTQTFDLWNPSTKRSITFSIPGRYFFYNSVAICYDRSNDDYKVIFLSETFHERDTGFLIYSIGNNSWMEKNCPFIKRCLPYSEGLVVVHGVLHWLGLEKIQELWSRERELMLSQNICKEPCCLGRSGKLPCYVNFPVYQCTFVKTEIWYLDMRDETPKKLFKPGCLEDNCVFDLASLRNELCLYRNTFDFTMMEIWMMKEYGNSNSWTKLLTIDNLHTPHELYSKPDFSHHVRPLCFTSEGDIVIDIFSSRFVIYNPNKKKHGEHQSYRKAWNDYLFLGSLAFPSRINVPESLAK